MVACYEAGCPIMVPDISSITRDLFIFVRHSAHLSTAFTIMHCKAFCQEIKKSASVVGDALAMCFVSITE
jgi:hypothetical protein